MVITNRVLKSKAGQIVAVRRSNLGKLNLYTVPHQGPVTKDLWVQIDTDGNNHLAFSFQFTTRCQDGKTSTATYFLKVVGNELQLENSPTKMTPAHRFERFNIESGEHYGLRSVDDPKKYLHVTPHKQMHVFCIRETVSDCVPVTDESTST